MSENTVHCTGCGMLVHDTQHAYGCPVSEAHANGCPWSEEQLPPPYSDAEHIAQLTAAADRLGSLRESMDAWQLEQAAALEAVRVAIHLRLCNYARVLADFEKLTEGDEDLPAAARLQQKRAEITHRQLRGLHSRARELFEEMLEL